MSLLLSGIQAAPEKVVKGAKEGTKKKGRKRSSIVVQDAKSSIMVQEVRWPIVVQEVKTPILAHEYKTPVISRKNNLTTILKEIAESNSRNIGLIEEALKKIKSKKLQVEGEGARAARKRHKADSEGLLKKAKMNLINNNRLIRKILNELPSQKPLQNKSAK